MMLEKRIKGGEKGREEMKSEGKTMVDNTDI